MTETGRHRCLPAEGLEELAKAKDPSLRHVLRSCAVCRGRLTELMRQRSLLARGARPTATPDLWKGVRKRLRGTGGAAGEGPKGGMADPGS